MLARISWIYTPTMTSTLKNDHSKSVSRTKYCFSNKIERFSNECRKTKTKVITLANYFGQSKIYDHGYSTEAVPL